MYYTSEDFERFYLKYKSKGNFSAMNALPEYSTLSEKQAFFQTPTQNYPWVVDTEQEFDKLYQQLCQDFNRDTSSGNPSLLYRGVNEARYKTFTSAQRRWIRNNWKNNTRQGFVEYVDTEIWNIKQWNDLKNFYRSLDVTPTDILYLAYLQHFRGASPLGVYS